MRRKPVSVFALVAIVAGITLGPATASATHEPTLLATEDPLSSTYGLIEPVTDGSYVVWKVRSYSPSTPTSTLISRRLSDQSESSYALDTFVGGTAMDDGMLVWSGRPFPQSGNSNIHAVNLARGTIVDVATTEDDEVDPAIDGDWVAWKECTTAGEVTDCAVLARNISTMDAPVTLTQAGDEWDRDRPVIAGPWVAWAEHSRATPGLWHIVVANVDRSVIKEIVAEGEQGELVGYDAAGTHLVFAAIGELRMVTLGSSGETSLTTGIVEPITDGRYVFGLDAALAGEFGGDDNDPRVDLLGYDIETGSRFVAASVVRDQLPSRDHIARYDAAGGMLTWERGEIGPYDMPFGSEIHAANIADRLPSARRPDPGMTSPDWTFYIETGHYLAGTFRSFWDGSGGLPVFGYPLTEEFSEHDVTAQYFERQRYEYHPEHAESPYVVELGLLGTEDAARRGLSGTTPFQPVGADKPGHDACVYFPETGHFVCAPFLAFWEQSGLEFGDAGVSFREALALFGYPISEPLVDPESGLVVQYFERARFEHHPANAGTPYEVLLGRLAVEKLNERGWPV